MKKYLILVCAGIAFVGVGVDFVQAAARHPEQASHTTAEQRDAGAALVATSTTDLTLLDDIALNDVITAAANSPTVGKRLMDTSKKDARIMKAFLSKLEHDIHYRDEMLITLLKDLEFCNMVTSTHGQEFPKVASTLEQAAQASAA